MKANLASVLVLSLLAACSGPPTRYISHGLGPVSDPVSSTVRSLPVETAAAVDLRMRDGSALVTAGRSDSIVARLTLSEHPDRDYRRNCTQPAAEAATISMRRVARTIDIQIEPKPGLRCSEHWTIEVPQNIDVVVTSEVASVTVSGIAGDVVATADVGNVKITGGGASALARVKSVGNASAESGSSSYAEAVAKASVGRTELHVDGHRVDVRRSPGPGGRIALKGSGRDRIIAETGVGDATVTLKRNQNTSDR